MSSLASVSSLIQSPVLLHILTFFALGMSIVSLWITRSAWIWGSFLSFSCIFAYLGLIVTPVAFIFIVALFIVQFLCHRSKDKKIRFFCFFLALSLSLGLATHYFPGFHNWLVIPPTQLSPDAPPFRLYLNFDKPFIGITILAMGLPLVQGTAGIKRAIRSAFIPTICGLTLLIFLALILHQIEWDPKLPLSLFWIFLIDNLIFVSIIEEAFWRGWIQRTTFFFFGGNTHPARAAILAIFSTSLAFALLHYFWVPSFPFLFLVFLASVIYGTIYQCTQMLEASIFCHFTFNVLHFFFFSYPILLPK